VHARLPLPVLLAVKLGPRCHMCDRRSKFEEDRRKARVVIVDDMYFGQIHIADRQTYTQAILYPSNAMHCIEQTINSQSFKFTSYFILDSKVAHSH